MLYEKIRMYYYVVYQGQKDTYKSYSDKTYLFNEFCKKCLENI